VTNKPKENLENLIGSGQTGFPGGDAEGQGYTQGSAFRPGNASDDWADHQRNKEIRELDAKISRDQEEQKHKQAIELKERSHARHMNIGAATFIALLVSIISVLLAVVSLDISIPWLGITGSNNSDVKKLAISSLGPLSGLSIGFFSGKIKWPG
jgi:hypothetical protein